MQKTPLYLFDFDSTFITSEGLDELAEISLKNHPDREQRIKKIKDLTQKGMEGKMPFKKSLSDRIKLLNTNTKLIQQAADHLKKKVSLSIRRNKTFFKKHHNDIYIISGGFKELILPVAKQFGIKPEHIFANTFLYDKTGTVIGIDTTNPMSQNQGKAKVVASLKLQNDIYIIGDGYTDYELKKLGHAKKFIAFTENIERELVVKNADEIAPNFDEFLYVNKLPRSFSYPKNRIKVLLLENVHQDAVKLFEKEGYTVEYQEKSLSEEALIKSIKDTSVLGIRSKTKITKEIINNAPHLLSIGVFAIGVNQIDLPAVTQKGITVFNAPYSNTRSVAEMIIGEILMLSRRTFEKSYLMHQGIWEKSATASHEVRGRKLGIIGYGHIGSQVSVLAEALGMEVYFYNTTERQAFGNAKKCTSMEELLKVADIITVHVSGKPENHNLISGKVFRQMRDGVLFLNASRGYVVDIEALVANIKSGKVIGAAIDVFPLEPAKKGDAFYTPLQNLPNVILTPHLGSGTEEAQKNIAQYVPEKVIDFINKGNTYLSVNIPNLQLPEQGNAHRFLHMHKNVPGVLANINNTLAKHKINILGQYLKTNEDIGYVITDVDKRYEVGVMKELKGIEDTIRFRVLY